MHEYLTGELEAAGFFFPKEKTELMKRNLRAAFARGQLTSQEVQTLRGALKALVQRRRKRQSDQ